MVKLRFLFGVAGSVDLCGVLGADSGKNAPLRAS